MCPRAAAVEDLLRVTTARRWETLQALTNGLAEIEMVLTHTTQQDETPFGSLPARKSMGVAKTERSPTASSPVSCTLRKVGIEAS